MKQNTVVAIIQARMASTRLPGKVLRKIDGMSILEILISRVKQSKQSSSIVVATTEKKEDDKIVEAVKNSGVEVYRGSEDDVLGRYVGASRAANADIVVRVTADNPLTDPELMDELIKAHRRSRADYTYCPGVPPGISVEVVNREALEKIDSTAKAPGYREHVTLYILDQPESWKIHTVQADELGLNYPALRLTVDTEEDLELMTKLNQNLGNLENLQTEEVIDFLNNHPEIREINAHVRQKVPKSGKKVTVIVRSYNQGGFIRDAIDSAINQVLPPQLYEILVIEDGSTDGSPDILKTYGNGIRVRIQPNQGAIKAINTGITSAKGKYVILLDADDTFEPAILAELFQALERERDIGFAYCDYYEKNLDTGETKVVSLKKNIFNSVAVGIMFRKAVLEEVGMYDESLVFPEYDLLIRLMKEHKGKYIPLPLFTYRRHKGSITDDQNKVKTGMQQLFTRYGEIDGLRDY